MRNNQKITPNPTIIRGFVTNKKTQTEKDNESLDDILSNIPEDKIDNPDEETKKDDPESDYTLVFAWTEAKNSANDLYFFKLGKDGCKVVKKIICGEVFLQYDPISHSLVYLINKTKPKKQGNPIKRTSTIAKGGLAIPKVRSSVYP